MFPLQQRIKKNYLSDWWDENSGTQVTSDADLFSAHCCMHSQKGDLDI